MNESAVKELTPKDWSKIAVECFGFLMIIEVMLCFSLGSIFGFLAFISFMQMFFSSLIGEIIYRFGVKKKIIMACCFIMGFIAFLFFICLKYFIFGRPIYIGGDFSWIRGWNIVYTKDLFFMLGSIFLQTLVATLLMVSKAKKLEKRHE